MMTQTERPQPRQRIGKVVSDRMDKTITVAVERQLKHKMYKKYITRTSKYLVHDEDESAGEGDIVEIMSTRPISKRKSWRLSRIIQRAK
jgi:small subunit ribosomal protein S17